ncbi:MAG TPA: hypothetical protein VJS38_19570 [Phenylobacterium sp.]|uniref:hypothetical protein n=1 Tax=Phenylobacterium sp. TaxID=1871053 RepID=UPI002B483877|nr:hypothetical protein [Phenylobacterium sp.]HKR90374.1 hypothetical protein [Phenylobacterium sp.]
MKTAIETAPAGAALRRAANRLALATVVLALVAIFTTICVGVALAAALLSMG